MGRKFFITVWLVVGTTIGGYVPTLWGDSFLSLASVIFSFLGGLAGIWLSFKIHNYFE